MTQTGTHGERRKGDILAAGLRLWREGGGRAVSARKIGLAVGITHRAVIYHFGSGAALLDALAAEAVRIGDAAIVPQLITAKHPAVADMPGVDRRRYLDGC